MTQNWVETTQHFFKSESVMQLNVKQLVSDVTRNIYENLWFIVHCEYLYNALLRLFFFFSNSVWYSLRYTFLSFMAKYSFIFWKKYAIQLHFYLWPFATCWLKWPEPFQSLPTLWSLTSSEILSAFNSKLKGCSDRIKCSGINIKWGLCSHCTLGLHPACIAYFFSPSSCMSWYETQDKRLCKWSLTAGIWYANCLR